MNKLMLAATLALSLGAYVNAADPCTPTGTTTTTKDGALVYDVSVKIRTTRAVAVTTKAIKGNDCSPGQDATGFCYRDVVSKSLSGFMVSCTNSCIGFSDSALLTLWNTKERAIYAEDELVEWDAFWRIGKTAQKAEVAWNAEGNAVESMDAQGFGTWNRANGRLTNASGSILMVLDPPFKVATKKPIFGSGDDAECVCEADAWLCTGLWADADFTVGFGTWRMKFNNNASNRYFANGVLPYPRNWASFVPYGLAGAEPEEI